MLGFLDDIFDIRWRHKIPIPIIASIPLLMVYYADNGNTHIVVPIPFRSLFGSLLNLGTLSYLYFRIGLLIPVGRRPSILFVYVTPLYLFNE
jgi:UDP-N-acetylglucosamine--dolichyl-phosphate N-acetylglucosaminephosphotransferase